MRRCFRISLIAVLLGVTNFAVIAQSVIATASKPLKMTQSGEVTKAEKLLDEWNPPNKDLLIEAEKILTKAIEKDPHDHFTLRQLSRLYLKKSAEIPISRDRQKFYEQAQLALEKAITINPEYTDAHVLGGNLYKYIGNLEKAKASLETARKLGANDAWFFFNLAEIEFQEKKYAEALKYYQLALKTPKTTRRPDILLLYGIQNSYWYLGDNSGYLSTFPLLIALQPDNAWPYGNYAMALLCSKDDFDESIVFFRQALSRMKYGYARRGLAGALYRKAVSYGVSAEQKTKLRNEAKGLFEGEPIEILTQICGASSNKVVLAYTSDAAK